MNLNREADPAATLDAADLAADDREVVDTEAGVRVVTIDVAARRAVARMVSRQDSSNVHASSRATRKLVSR